MISTKEIQSFYENAPGVEAIHVHEKGDIVQIEYRVKRINGDAGHAKHPGLVPDFAQRCQGYEHLRSQMEVGFDESAAERKT